MDELAPLGHTGAGLCARCAIELKPATLEPAAAYLFVEDDGRVYRFDLTDANVRIGRDQSNDIWIDSPAVRPQTCLVYHRDGEHHLKVFDGARVLLNGQAVRGLNRLYSGDRLGVGDRELLYGRDDSPAQVALGITVLLDGEVHHAVVVRRTRFKVGCRDADLKVDDDSVADEQLTIECYSDHGLYAVDSGSRVGTMHNGKLFQERCQLRDGDVLQFGRVALAIAVLPAEAHGLLIAPRLPERHAAAASAVKAPERPAPQRGEPPAPTARPRQQDAKQGIGGFVRPDSNPNAAVPAAVPADRRPPAPEPLPEVLPAPDHAGPAATQIGSLQQMLRDAQQNKATAPGEPQHTVMADAVRSQLGEYMQRAAPAQRRTSEQLRPEEIEALDQAPSVPSARDQVAAGNAPVERPAVRIQIDKPPPTAAPRPPERRPVWQDESSQRENLRVRPRETAAESAMVATSGSAGRPAGGGFHELRTEMLDTQSVRDSAGTDWQQDPILRRVFANSVMRPEGAPSTEVMEAYRPDARAQDGWPPGNPQRREPEAVRDDDPRHRQVQRDRAAVEELRVPGQQDRYRLGRGTGAHDPGYRDSGPVRMDEREGLQPPRDDFRRSQSMDREPARDGFRRSQAVDSQDPERYRISRGEPPARHVQDDRPRVKVRELSEAERRANRDYDQSTDRPKSPQGETDASRREREQRIIDSSRRGFDRDRDR